MTSLNDIFEAQRNGSNFPAILLYDRSRNLFDYVLMGITVGTNLFQAFILWLILCKSPDTLREYRLYLCGMTLSDLLFNFSIGILIEPKLWTPDSLGSHVMGLAQHWGEHGGRLAYAMAAFALTSQILLLMFSVVFRLANVKCLEHTNLHLRLQKRSSKLQIVSLVLAVGILVAVVSFWGTLPRQTLLCWHFYEPVPENWPDIYTKELDAPLNWTGNMYQPMLDEQALEDALAGDMPDQMRARVKYSIQNMSYTNEMMHLVNAVQLHYPILYFDILHARIVLMCIIYFCCIALVLTVSLCVSLSMVRYLRQHRHAFSAHTYSMQLQLTILLVIQIVEPMVLVFCPVVLILISLLQLNIEANLHLQISIFSVHSLGFAQMLVFGLILYSFINSMLILCFVGPYRRVCVSLVKRLRDLTPWPRSAAVSPLQLNTTDEV